MDDWEINIHQRMEEIDKILRKLIEGPGDELGVAFGIVTKVSDIPGVPPSWTIRIDDSQTVLTADILFRYMSEHKDLKIAIDCFMRDHFPSFVSFFGSR
ncbi:hypothetical protein FE782_19040 [Paenibacillus antri]|uniref:Uncharacterized protein n=1 Tax=Paenibacillus antri TaxID=2582848 RepID=A0A5R9G353_9BACL|nr:hypothetical protein [Paenibacillus antri]TLS50792.1 hypothetical protein FE782_19040 [Paenibacillus antri]